MGEKGPQNNTLRCHLAPVGQMRDGNDSASIPKPTTVPAKDPWLLYLPGPHPRPRKLQFRANGTQHLPPSTHRPFAFILA